MSAEVGLVTGCDQGLTVRHVLESCLRGAADVVENYLCLWGRIFVVVLSRLVKPRGVEWIVEYLGVGNWSWVAFSVQGQINGC